MTKVRRYIKASSLDGALEARRGDPAAAWLAGGTLLLAGDYAQKPESAIDLSGALPRGIARRPSELEIGALASFQEMAESAALPRCLSEAALTMANRNTRNRATLGGNLGADKSCSSLVPLLIALEAEAETASPWPRKGEGAIARASLEAWLRSRAEEREVPRAAELLVRVFVPLRPGRRAAYRRWNRVACDLSVVGAACAYELEGGKIRRLRVALGGLGPKARRFPAIEELFEGSAPPSREEVEVRVAPLLRPIDDLRASADFKRLRGAQLLADALCEATGLEARELKAGTAAATGDREERQ